MQYAFVPHTFINSIYAIFCYIAMIPYANSVIASLQYANTVTAIFPLCQSSTLPFCSMMNLQHDSITIATEQESRYYYDTYVLYACLEKSQNVM